MTPPQIDRTPQIHHHEHHSTSSAVHTLADLAALIDTVGPYPVVLDRDERRWMIIEIPGDTGHPVLRARPLPGRSQFSPPTGTPTAAALLAAEGPLLPTSRLTPPVAVDDGRGGQETSSIDTRTCALLWGRLPAREWMYSLAAGWTDPLVPDEGHRRWNWHAQILDSPQWGMVTVAPAHRELFTDAAELCRTLAVLDTASAGPDVIAQLEQQWSAVESAATAAICEHDPTPPSHERSEGNRGVFEALDALVEMAVDALEVLHGQPASGAEAEVSAFDALVHAHSPAVGRALLINLIAHTLTAYPSGRTAVTEHAHTQGQPWRTAS
ncbi:MAG: hypothetical protein WBD41_02735 [Rhodococcus sp. (in: high G+C Gram-positive bacteria)]